MKKILILLCAAILTIAVSFAQTQTQTPTQAQPQPQNQDDQKKDDKNAPVIDFKVLEHNFGTFEQGGNGTFEFEFENTGKEPLIINNVQTSCGCTVPEWPRDPIEKGKSSAIKVKYDTQRIGSFNKTITVLSNAKNSPVVLKISGQINQRPPGTPPATTTPATTTTAPTPAK